MTVSPVTTAVADQTELVVALVAAVGTDVGLVGDQVATQLDEYGYTSHPLRLSDYLAEQADADFRNQPFDEALWDAMTVGDDLRQTWERSDALALHAISDIVATRYEVHGIDPEKSDALPPNLDRHAFILRSLKNPDELETLRAVYGPRLVVIAAYSPRDKRLEHLAEQIEDSRNKKDRSSWTHQPQVLVDRDEREEEKRGQDVSGTFHRADFFIRGWDREVIQKDVRRTLNILFGSPFRTPTRDEHAQFMAAGAALRSAEFGRQVGAAIATAGGSVIALGTNEVPTAGGGSHWEEDGVGNRDFEIRDTDSNRQQFDALTKRLADQIEARIERIASQLADEGHDQRSLVELQAKTVETLPIDLRMGGIGELTEFGRAVHAEMNALLDAVRRGVPVQDATLYTTTFPCHNCARHIIGAGLRRVVFIEPYIKSRAEELHEDAVEIDESGTPDHKVAFVPFVGVAPRRYLEVFDAAFRTRLGHQDRQDSLGRKAKFKKKSALPVFADAGLAQFRPDLREYRAKELLALDYFKEHAESNQ
jgi:cytidine deaminase